MKWIIYIMALVWVIVNTMFTFLDDLWIQLILTAQIAGFIVLCIFIIRYIYRSWSHKLLKRTIYIILISWAVISALFAFQENPILQLLLMMLFLGLLFAFTLSIICFFRMWPQGRLRAIIPFCLCLAVLLIPGRLAISARDAYFRSIIPDLESAVEEYKTTGEMPETGRKGYGVTPEITEDGDVFVTFWWGGGFPVRHRVLMYCETDDPYDYFKDRGWYRGDSLSEQWWVLGD